jgi:tetratricopeptide (TPR) repeat protein
MPHMIGKMEGLGMTSRVASTRSFAIFLALGLGHHAACAQGIHLDALREWLRNTEEAAQYVDKGDYAKAEERLRLAIKEVRPYLPETQRVMARSYCELARVLYHQKRYADAEPLARWALSVREADKKAKPDAVFQSLYTLGLIRSAQKQHGEAEALLKRSLTIQETNLGPDHVNSAVVVNQLALVYLDQAKYADAEALYQKAIAIHERKTPAENLDLATTAEKYAELLRRMKRFDDAERWRSRAVAIRENVAAKAAKAKADREEIEFRGFK